MWSPPCPPPKKTSWHSSAPACSCLLGVQGSCCPPSPTLHHVIIPIHPHTTICQLPQLIPCSTMLSSDPELPGKPPSPNYYTLLRVQAGCVGHNSASRRQSPLLCCSSTRTRFSFPPGPSFLRPVSSWRSSLLSLL